MDVLDTSNEKSVWDSKGFDNIINIDDYNLFDSSNQLQSCWDSCEFDNIANFALTIFSEKKSLPLSSTDSSNSTPNSPTQSNNDSDQKNELTKERNRRASRRYRETKKRKSEEIEEKLAFMEQQIYDQELIILQLKQENFQLRSQFVPQNIPIHKPKNCQINMGLPEKRHRIAATLMVFSIFALCLVLYGPSSYFSSNTFDDLHIKFGNNGPPSRVLLSSTQDINPNNIIHEDTSESNSQNENEQYDSNISSQPSNVFSWSRLLFMSQKEDTVY